jgi:hypothetical protein
VPRFSAGSKAATGGISGSIGKNRATNARHSGTRHSYSSGGHLDLVSGAKTAPKSATTRWQLRGFGATNPARNSGFRGNINWSAAGNNGARCVVACDAFFALLLWCYMVNKSGLPAHKPVTKTVPLLAQKMQKECHAERFLWR